jgi:excisionase family DNA binding protein
MEEMLTLGEVAKRLKVSVKTIRRWLQDGRLTGFKMGKLWRVKETELESFVERQTQQRKEDEEP